MLVIFYFLLRSNSVTTSSNLSELFSAGLINKNNEKNNKQTNKLMIFLVKLYFSSTFNYIQFNHINLQFLPFLQHLTDDFQIGSAMRFFKNASKTQYSGRKKISWEGAPKKFASIHPWKKWRRSPIKINFLVSDAPEIKWVSCLCFHSEHTDATLKCHSMCVV